MLIGFVGGCITHQPGIPYPQLFHRVLVRWFDDQGLGRISFVVARNPHQEPSQRVETLIRKHNPDLIIVHRSAHTFFTKAMAVFYAGERYVVHPFLVDRRPQRSWNDYEQENFASCLGVPAHAKPNEATRIKTIPASSCTSGITAAVEAPPKAKANSQIMPALQRIASYSEGKLRRLRPKDLPWLVGEFSGLITWAINDELSIVDNALNQCRSGGVKLLIVGPGLRIGYPWVNRHAHQLDSGLKTWAEKRRGVSYVSLLRPLADNRSPSVLSAEHYQDAIHFNSSGHRHLASRLEPALLQAIEGHNSART